MRLNLSPSAAPAVASALLDYLEHRLGVARPTFSEEPVFIPDGWETCIYRFRLAGASTLPRGLDRPLVLRVYCSDQGWPRLQHEFAVQKHMRGLGYPVPRPLLLEQDAAMFGGPFMLMDAVGGENMLNLMLRNFPAIFWAPALMGAAQARLHLFPATGIPTSSTPFLDRRLAELRHLVDEYALADLLPGLEWLEAHRPDPQKVPSILHLDFHPANLIFFDGDCRGVLDWCESDVGDRHADLAASILLIDSTPLENQTMIQRLATLAGRWPLKRFYLKAYRRILPIDRAKLRYYLGWATFHRLCRWATWLCDSPLVTGSKPSALAYLTPRLIRSVELYFQKHTGVAIHLHPIPRARAAEVERLFPAIPQPGAVYEPAKAGVVN